MLSANTHYFYEMPTNWLYLRARNFKDLRNLRA
jgi:hypothetical protein